MHRCQTYLQLDIRSCTIFEYIISRRNDKNNGFLAGVPLLPSPSREVLRPKPIPFPFERLSRRLFCAQRNNLQLIVLNSDEQQKSPVLFQQLSSKQTRTYYNKKKLDITYINFLGNQTCKKLLFLYLQSALSKTEPAFRCLY